jgi:HAD superfamily hydrolase (TIGR01549 family)
MTVAVLFDLEDTLVQTPWVDAQHVTEFRRRTREKLIQLGIPPSVLEGIERTTLMRNKAAEYIEENMSEEKAEKFRRAIEKFISKYELDAAQRSKLFPETVLALEKLRKLDVKMGLVTNTSMKAVEIDFQLHGLKKYFDVVVTRESMKKLKPDSEGILLALKKLDAKSFFLVGDLVHDAVAAENAGGTSIIVKRNAYEKLDFNADFIIQSLTEVPEIVQSQKGKV